MPSAKDKEEALKHWQSTPVYLTPEGLADLKGKLEHLKRILPGLVDEVTRTRAYGDLSENVEYVDAKGKLRRTQNNIYRIEDQLKKVVIIESGASSSGKVQIGSTVVLETGDGAKKTFRIVGPAETDPAAGLISKDSPLGTTLIGHGVGEIVSITLVTGEKEYKILEIK